MTANLLTLDPAIGNIVAAQCGKLITTKLTFNDVDITNNSSPIRTTIDMQD